MVTKNKKRKQLSLNAHGFRCVFHAFEEFAASYGSVFFFNEDTSWNGHKHLKVSGQNEFICKQKPFSGDCKSKQHMVSVGICHRVSFCLVVKLFGT